MIRELLRRLTGADQIVILREQNDLLRGEVEELRKDLNHAQPTTLNIGGGER